MLFKSAIAILKYPLVELQGKPNNFGFVNKNFFEYHAHNIQLTKTLQRGKELRFFEKTLDLYKSRFCYYTYDYDTLECDCPNFAKYGKCKHELALFIHIQKKSVIKFLI